jgi:hypothetical protein
MSNKESAYYSGKETSVYLDEETREICIWQFETESSTPHYNLVKLTMRQTIEVISALQCLWREE